MLPVGVFTIVSRRRPEVTVGVDGDLHAVVAAVDQVLVLLERVASGVGPFGCTIAGGKPYTWLEITVLLR